MSSKGVGVEIKLNTKDAFLKLGSAAAGTSSIIGELHNQLATAFAAELDKQLLYGEPKPVLTDFDAAKAITAKQIADVFGVPHDVVLGPPPVEWGLVRTVTRELWLNQAVPDMVLTMCVAELKAGAAKNRVELDGQIDVELHWYITKTMPTLNRVEVTDPDNPAHGPVSAELRLVAKGHKVTPPWPEGMKPSAAELLAWLREPGATAVKEAMLERQSEVWEQDSECFVKNHDHQIAELKQQLAEATELDL